MKRIFSLILVVFMTVGLLAACGDSETTSSTASNDQATSSSPSTVGQGTNVTDPLFSVEKVNYITSDNASVYRIIRPEGNDDLTNVAGDLFKKMKDALGVSLRNSDDSNDGTDTYEILIGHTNRPESQQALDFLKTKSSGRYNNFIVCTIGQKIVLNSQSPEGIKNACEYFAANYIKKEGIDGGIAFVKEADGNFENITINGVNIGKYSIVRPLYNSSYLTQIEMEKIVDHVYSKTGYMLDIVYDNATETDYEIVVGNCNRNGADAIGNYNTWLVDIQGKKVYLNGGSAHSTALAVSEFCKNLNGDINDSASKTGDYNTTIATYNKSTTYKQVWGDDFDGNTIDATKWWHIGENGWKSEGLNGKTSVRSSNPDDVYVADGCFYICARQDDNYYYGGMLRTQTTMTYKYGYIETSVLLPHGDGFWVALWQMTAYDKSQITSEPEIDFVECFGNSAYYAVNAHAWPTEDGEALGWTHTSFDADPDYVNIKKHSLKEEGVRLGDGMHTYGMLWTDTVMTFTCDGEAFLTYDTTATEQRVNTFNQPQYLIISMATGFKSGPGTITSDPLEWELTNKFVVDWLHIYQPSDGKHKLNILK